MIKRVLFVSCLILGLSTVAHATRDDVLILVNDNSIDSPVIGAYYAEQRNINPDNIVHLKVPNSYFISWNEFRSLRDQIIHFMQQKTLDDPALTPVTCTDGDLPYYCQASIDQLRAHTKIRYLITTRGVPSRMTVDGSTQTSATAPTSVDNYLMYWLVNYFTDDARFQFMEREKAFGDGRGMRAVIPADDQELIVGRIDGLDLDHARALVDRALRAESEGLYGRLFSSSGFFRWTNHITRRPIYPITTIFEDPYDGWRYLLGIFGESRPECIDFLQYPGDTPEGKTPTHCQAQINGEDHLMSGVHYPAPGNTRSRQPQASNALIYQGWLDGQKSIGNFAGLLNWRKNDQCSVTLCENSDDPATCRAASTDVVKEINTECVGVADGFMGYNHQSFPVSYFTLWPTGWYQTLDNASWNNTGHGDVNNLGFPEVRNDIGFDDKQSVWFRNSDQVVDPKCHSGSDFSMLPSASCEDSRRVIMVYKTSVTTQTLNSVNPQIYRVALRYKANNINTPTTLRVRFYVHETGAGDAQIDYGLKTLVILPVGNSDWTLAETQFQLNPGLHTATSYDGIKIRIESAAQFSGELGLDVISVQQRDQSLELINNGSFAQGFKQVVTGDHAAVFLNRLNGVAFWGSLSHHASGGCAFCYSGLEYLVYFMRGLPLGDAVWFNENRNSGVLYGDPLYSPVVIRLNPVNVGDTVSGLVNLHGSAINGRDPTKVSTTYAIEYCPGTDFFICDQTSNAWRSTGISGLGGKADMLLGVWDTTSVVPGDYILRLAVTSTHLVNGKTQTFYDYYFPLTVQAVDPALAGSLGFELVNYSVEESVDQATITVVRSGGSTGMVSVDYMTSDGSAIQGIDYTSTSGTLTFNAGEISKSFNIPLIINSEQEGNETVNLTLQNPQGGAGLAATINTVLTILDFDPPVGNLGFELANYSVEKSAGQVSITVVRTDGSEGEVSVDYSISNGTALQGSDYTTTSGTLTFATGEISKTFTIALIVDSVFEGNKTIYLTLQNAQGGAGLDARTSAVLTILGEDPRPSAGSLGFVMMFMWIALLTRVQHSGKEF